MSDEPVEAAGSEVKSPEKPQDPGTEAPKPQWTPGKIKKAARDRLSDLGLAMTGSESALEWVISGTKEAALGNLAVVFQRLQSVYAEFSADPEVRSLAIAGSVHIQVGPSNAEDAASFRVLEKISELESEIDDQAHDADPGAQDGETDVPVSADDARENEVAIDETEPPEALRLSGPEAELRRLARSSVPNTVVANSVLLDLIVATTAEGVEQPLARALKYGSGVARTYQGLVHQLADDGLAMEVNWALEQRSVTVSSDRLAEVSDALAAGGKQDTFDVSVTGTLDMAAARQREFRLEFAKDIPRPDVLADWRHGTISGTYSSRLRASIRDQGLWDTEVVARLRITREARRTSALRSPPQVELVAVRPRFGKTR